MALRGLGLGLAEIAAALADDGDLRAAVEAERAKGTDPADPRVQKLAARWRELVEQFTGGHEAIAASLKVYCDDRPNAYGVSPELRVRQPRVGRGGRLTQPPAIPPALSRPSTPPTR